MNAGKRSPSEIVAEAKKNALEMMKKAGFQLGDGIQVSVDPKLPFMGYSHPLSKGFQIVVSGGAIGTGMLEGLLTHEMSHIYRMQTKHPSHNADIIQAVLDEIDKRTELKDYQQKILQDLVNNVEDLYADDVSFKVLRNTSVFPPEQMSSFLQDWVTSAPSKARDPTRERWQNAWIMANNARAIAQMRRHRVEDTGEKAAKANNSFLSQVEPSMTRNYDYFLNLLTNMKEDLTDESYKRFLTEYLTKFIETADVN